MSGLFVWIVRGAIRQRHAVVGIAVIGLGVGIWHVSTASLDALPSFTPPMATVQAEAPGFGSRAVEQRVTTPLEQALLSTPGLASLRSRSVAGLAVLDLTFTDGTDLGRARQLVAERLALARERLPAGLPAPQLTSVAAPVGALLKLCYTAAPAGARDRRGLEALWRFADLTLRPRLEAIPGISRVTIHGGRPPRIEVQPRVTQMIARGVTRADLRRAVTGQLRVTALGTTTSGAMQYTLRQPARALEDTLASLRAAVVARRTGLPVRLDDVARVVMGAEPAVGNALYDGRPALYVQIDKLPWADTLRLTRRVERTLAELDQQLPLQARRHPPLYRQADFVRTSVFSVARAMAIGAVLVVLILLAFLGRGRLAVIPAVAIPLSLLAAIVVLVLFGISLNGLVLGGLAIAVGEVVDDGIVDVENIWRRLRENAVGASPRPALDVILEASIEVRSAVVNATLIVAVVLAPILLLGGLAGRIFSPLAVAYGLAIAASLAVALTLTPALCALLLPRLVAGAAPPRETWVTRGVRRVYDRALGLVGRRPWVTLAVGALLGAFTLAALPLLRGGFLPEFREGILIAEVTTRPGTSLAESTRLASRLHRAVRGERGVVHTAARIGRATLDEDAAPSHRIEMDLRLSPDVADVEDLTDRVVRRLQRVPGVRLSVEGFLGERINELLSGARAPLLVKLLGERWGALLEAAPALARRIATLPGVISVSGSALGSVPTMDVSPDRGRLLARGLHVDDLSRAVAEHGQGETVGEMTTTLTRPVPVVLAAAGAPVEPHRLAEIPLFPPAGGIIPLSQVARVTPRWEPVALHHEQGRRMIGLAVDADQDELGAVAARIEALVARPGVVPAGVDVRLAGRAIARRESGLRLALGAAVMLLCVLLILWRALGSLTDALVVIAGVPMGLLGGVLIVPLLPGGLTMAALVGFVTLTGIICRHGIMLVTHKGHLLATAGGASEELALQAARERLIPILMTSSTALLGLLPLALSLGAAGSELEAPMAAVVCGGIVTSTLLNLLVVPAFFLRQQRSAAAKEGP